MALPFIGQIQMWGTTFSPMDWATCSGQLIPISQNQALYSIIGNIYGGDGRVTMGVPELNGRAPMHSGTGPGLNQKHMGYKYGTPTVVLTSSSMPEHGHGGVYCYTNFSDLNKLTDDPQNAVPALRKDAQETFDFVYQEYDESNAGNMEPNTISVAGQSQGHENRQPLTALRFCLALDGMYPPRS